MKAEDFRLNLMISAQVESAGERLDKAIAILASGLGLRARRRLIEQGHARVNGKAAHPGYRVRKGQILTLDVLPEQPRVLPMAEDGEYAIYYKPAGLHTAQISGSLEPSLESSIANPQTRLLQRLDFATSGLVLAAKSDAAAAAFRHWEKTGQCLKLYLALLAGNLQNPAVAMNRLDTANRAKTAILPAIAPILRHSLYWPLTHPTPATTLALCAIAAGQRHQIRAHALSLGHPLLGDELYGQAGGQFLLEHFCLKFPGHTWQLTRPDSAWRSLEPALQDKVERLAAEAARVFSRNGGDIS